MVGLTTGGGSVDTGQLSQLFSLKSLFAGLAKLNPFSQPDMATVPVDASTSININLLGIDVGAQINATNQRYNNLATAFNTLVANYNALKNQVATMTTMTNNLQAAGST